MINIGWYLSHILEMKSLIKTQIQVKCKNITHQLFLFKCPFLLKSISSISSSPSFSICFNVLFTILSLPITSLYLFNFDSLSAFIGRYRLPSFTLLYNSLAILLMSLVCLPCFFLYSRVYDTVVCLSYF